MRIAADRYNYFITSPNENSVHPVPCGKNTNNILIVDDDRFIRNGSPRCRSIVGF